jgi:hydrogenase assembly chaperone HypC/HupF
MCIGIPGKVIDIKDNQAKVKQDDHCHWLDLSLIDQPVKKGDYLLSYQNAAINKLSKKQAEEVLTLLKNQC